MTRHDHYASNEIAVDCALCQMAIAMRPIDSPPIHTVNGKTSTEGWPYGTTHDMDCPGCQDTPFLASPRSETYWSS